MRLRIDWIPLGKDQGERDGTGVGRPVCGFEAKRRRRDRPAPEAGRAPAGIWGQRRRKTLALLCRLRCLLIVREHHGKRLSTLFWPIVDPVNGVNLSQSRARIGLTRGWGADYRLCYRRICRIPNSWATLSANLSTDSVSPLEHTEIPFSSHSFRIVLVIRSSNSRNLRHASSGSVN